MKSMSISEHIKGLLNSYRTGRAINKKNEDYLRRFKKFSFFGEKCIDPRQYEAVIIRWYHTIEKGLSYINYRAGFGKNNVIRMIKAMENYVADGYDVEAFFYKTALSVLYQYIEKNHANGYEDREIEDRIKSLKGVPNDKGGAFYITPLPEKTVQEIGYKDFVLNRHSFRHYSGKPVALDKVKRALALAQNTPSACNRQGWKSRIIIDKTIIKDVCLNQNGNRGFGHEFDMMIIVTGDLRCFNRNREIFQVYIDGGMYAENILNSLHYYHIASVPLSASLTETQEERIRKVINMHEAEVLIMMIGIGNYPDENECLVARSERKPPEYKIL